ncbi:MAG: S9 family peptidase [Spirosomataceae bacterium]
MKKFFSLCIGVLFFSAAWAQNGAEKIKVTDMTKIKQVTGVVMSPDGKRAIYTLQTIEPSEENKLEYDYKTHLWLTDFVNPPKPLTRGAESARQPSFSPDGSKIVFARTIKGKSQLFVMPLDGGEAFQLTDWKYGAGGPVWSPDGKYVAFGAGSSLTELLKDSVLNPRKVLPSWSLEKPGFSNNDFLRATNSKVKPNPDGSIEEIRAYLSKDEEDKKAKVFNRLQFQGEATTQPELNFNHIFVVEAKEGAKPRAVTQGFWSYNLQGWTPDGNLLATSGLDSLVHPDREQDSQILVISLATGAKQKILGSKGSQVGQPELSPDGKRMAFSTSPSQGVNFGQLMLANADGSGVQAVGVDRAAGNYKWSSDQKYLYFTASSNGGVPLYRVDAKSLKVEQLTDFDTGVGSFDFSNERVVFAKTEVANPSELYTATLDAKNQTRLSDHNTEWLKTKKLSFPEKRTLVNSKKQKVEYWIMKPSTLEAGKKYPLMLNMHGGPTAMWGPGEISMWHEFQYFCSQGYGIVYGNPRGSGGYGIDFQRANIKDWGTGPASDVLATCSDAAKEAWVDTSRQVITGGSYAGYLTAWIVSQDHRFKAAFAQRGVYDLTTFMGEGNAWRLVPNYFQYPWLDKKDKVLDNNSPYYFVDTIRTPLLIKHGENDLRTGPIQSEMMYKSLKVLGKDVEYVRMPGATHELSRSGNVRQRIDRMLRIYEFFERFVGTKK